MVTKLVIMLICFKLHIRIGDKFRFTNQRSKNNYYMFVENGLVKWTPTRGYVDARVSLNWLLNSECEVLLVC